MSSTINLGSRIIGEGHPCFIIAEIGINFNGDIEIAKKLIDAAANAKCDAVKFQLFSANKMYPKSAGEVTWKSPSGDYQYDIFKAVQKNELPTQWLETIIQHCKARNIILFASVFDEESLATLVKHKFPIIKIGSSEITHIPLLQAAAKTGLPIIISTGGSTIDEIKDAYNTLIKHNTQIGILHCNVQYPTPLSEVHMNTLDTLRKEFPLAIIGFSDHTSEPSFAPIAAIDKGASIIEKHITLDRKMPGPDQFFALEPQELIDMVSAVRKGEKDKSTGKKITYPQEILGSAAKEQQKNEQYLRSFAYRCIFTTAPIKKGERFTVSNTAILRPGKKQRGLEPKRYEEIISKYVAAKDYAAEEAVTEQGVAKA